MSDAFTSIETGLKEALAHARGEAAATMHQIELGEPDVPSIRARTGLPQTEFARPSASRKARF